MIGDDQERSLRRVAKANRDRLAVAHREVVMQERQKEPLMFAKTWSASRALRLDKQKHKGLGRKSPKQTSPQHPSTRRFG